MSKHDFAAAEFAGRQARVRAAMQAAGIDLLLVHSPVNIHYLIASRAKSYQEYQCLYFTLEEGPLTVLTRLAEVAEFRDLALAEDVRGWGGREPEDPMEAARGIMAEKGYLARRIGLEVPYYYLSAPHYLALRDVLGDALVLDATHLVEDLKLVKSTTEIAYIRKASEFADAAMQTTVESVAEGRTELEVAAEIHRTLMRLGSESPASPMNFGTGERTCYGHPLPSERRIETGDFMHIEFAGVYRRYCATIGRQMCQGEPTPRMRELYRVVRDACDECIAEIRGGVPAVRPHEAAKKVIADAGLDEYRLHTTGYGIAPGYPPSWGESIHMFGGSTYTLEAGMVVSVEPPVLIHEERLGARIIDDVLVTDTGAEILSTFTRDLIVL